MTSGSGSAASTVAGAAPHNGENKPPQAVVKPQILTHVIEGFVIQEGAEPFPVGRSSLLVGGLKPQYAQELLAERAPQHDNTTTTDSEMEEPYLQGEGGIPRGGTPARTLPRLGSAARCSLSAESKEEGAPPKLKCELCGRVDFAYKFKRSKRFCSMACAKRYNVGCTKRVGLFHPDRSKLQKPGVPPHGRRRACKVPTLSKDTKKQLNHSQEDSSRCSDNSSYEEPLSPISASSSASRRRQAERDLELHDMELPDMHVRELAGIGHRFLPSEPSKWNVEDVYEFIRSLPGCQEIAEEFRAQEIDGQALLLLKEDHLMSTMNIKLGPALKIYARISMLKDS
uniref:Polyhomeotic homolog 2 n=1 Tax=Gallus gallus TaxID=9031 RepID=A0A8V0Z2E9_CHICK